MSFGSTALYLLSSGVMFVIFLYNNNARLKAEGEADAERERARDLAEQLYDSFRDNGFLIRRLDGIEEDRGF